MLLKLRVHNNKRRKLEWTRAHYSKTNHGPLTRLTLFFCSFVAYTVVIPLKSGVTMDVTSITVIVFEVEKLLKHCNHSWQFYCLASSDRLEYN